MKKFFLSLIAIMVATMSFAQGSHLATLSHNGQISAFYGASALGQALEVADNGDVITLSSGMFNAADITKAVTLRGAGMSVNTDSINSHEATIIKGSFNINMIDSIDARVSLEGLYNNGTVTYSGNLKNSQFLKCRFYNFVSDKGTITNTSFIHCRFSRECLIAANSNAYFINCVISGIGQKYTNSNVEFDNCFINFSGITSNDYGNLTPAACVNAYYKNCILTYYLLQNYQPGISSTCVAYNCVGIGSGNNIFNNILDKNNTNVWVGTRVSDIFKTYKSYNTSADLSDAENFELTDEAKTKYLGTDGTQVGIYGGNLAYDENPTTPQITKCNVASKSTADGKLSVEIEVKAAEY